MTTAGSPPIIESTRHRVHSPRVTFLGAAIRRKSIGGISLGATNSH